jgi:uncharacterized protein YdbL (DUF1318 family)|tara:strand:- start:7749 stop:8075 length:327 start_codon:yes stop_codon:yes gene_type:complete
MNIKTLFIAATLLVASQLSFALTLDEAREKGMLGENASGYVEITPRGNADAKAVMEEVNTKRKAKYQAIANEQNIAIEKIEKIAGEKITEKLSTGQFYKDINGKWNKK